jgi:hypothetical protein
MTAGPFEERYSEAFHLAEVRSFDDLHVLGFIRKEITENEMIEALRADESVFREASRKHQHRAAYLSNCSCDESGSGSVVALPRRLFQDHLIELLQPLSRELLAVDDPEVRHHYYHARSWLSRSNLHLVGIFTLNNINIEDRATLTMTPTVQALYANEITIGNQGVFRFTSGGVHVRCNVLNGPRRVFSEVRDITKYMTGLTREVRWREQQ